MSLQPKARPDQHAVLDWPVYWFVKLAKAVEAGDHQAAAEAQRQLERLGVRVQYGRPVANQPAPRLC
jgi:hypothetical protein